MIIAHEEVLRCIVSDFNGAAVADDLAVELVVSKTTARRRCEDMVERGWLWRYTGEIGPQGTRRAVGYSPTERGYEALRTNEGW
jgi:DNA-binding MarR family transcriptional regulator